MTLDLCKVAGKGITMGSDFRVPALADADRCFGPASLVRTHHRHHWPADESPAVSAAASMPAVGLQCVDIRTALCMQAEQCLEIQHSVLSLTTMCRRPTPPAMPTRRSPLWNDCMLPWWLGTRLLAA